MKDSFIGIVRIAFIALFFCLGFFIGNLLSSIKTENEIYSKYCSYYNMEYNSSLDCCVEIKEKVLKEIEWAQKEEVK